MRLFGIVHHLTPFSPLNYKLVTTPRPCHEPVNTHSLSSPATMQLCFLSHAVLVRASRGEEGSRGLKRVSSKLWYLSLLPSHRPLLSFFAPKQKASRNSIPMQSSTWCVWSITGPARDARPNQMRSKRGRTTSCAVFSATKVPMGRCNLHFIVPQSAAVHLSHAQQAVCAFVFSLSFDARVSEAYNVKLEHC